MGECLNLKAEVIRHRLTFKQISATLGISEKSLRNKIRGNTDFQWEEIKTIHNTFFPEIDKDVLFARSA